MTDYMIRIPIAMGSIDGTQKLMVLVRNFGLNFVFFMPIFP